ncbi:magnesium transporter [Dethiosulfatarculus sandiegensis]|uniref:Magnesium transporter MgtE n=1 Tax=Dethiosulfatarculus sandiegensis TaxID=1429043 RepID=A0A0D2J9V5_9BACT|nr:magnesium transporter [Dethiosulfatarculus sandiegensis]KIX14934.1 hypothetical protein X474_07235 [Dethiosulfatarculus sandiegensis]
MQNLLNTIKDQLETGKLNELSAMAADMHPADLAHAMESLTDQEKRDVFQALDPKTATEVVVELSEYSRDQVLEGLHPNKLAEIVDELPSDEATDIIAELPTDQAREVLSRLDEEDSDEVRALLIYDEDSAGGIMQLELVSILESQTASEAIEAIRIKREEVEDIHNLFVLDNQSRVVGMLPLSKLILADPLTRIRDIMEPCPLFIQADEDQEAVAHKFRRYDVVSAPVVDAKGRLMGRITIDDVMEIMQDEAQEDIARMAGISGEDEMFLSRDSFKMSRMRLPWLLVNLGGGLVSGWLLWHFKMRLADALFLLAFIPVIMAMAGNVGVQSATIVVRGFAVGQINMDNIRAILFKEIRVALIMGVVCGLTAGTVAFFWHHNPYLGLVVGLAMTSAISAASILGTLAPALFKLLNVDPAISSGPVVATLNDIMGLLIYFGISTIFYTLLVQ